MGNSGSKYTPPPATPMPVEDSVGARNEAAQLISQRMSHASRTANDLTGDKADDQDALTRSQVAKGDSFSAQPRPHGPAHGRRPHSAATRMSTGSMGGSTVLTG